MGDLKINHSGVNTTATWSNADASENNVELKPRSAPSGAVPNVVGMGAMDAMYLLENYGLHVIIDGKGDVVSQCKARQGADDQQGQQSPCGPFVPMRHVIA